MIWVIFWALIAIAVLGFMAWSLNTLLRQKKAWEEFAKRYKLEYIKTPLLQPAAITGTLYGRKVNIYVQTEESPGQRMLRASTHVEVFLNNIPEAAMLVSARAVPAMLQDFVLPSTINPSDPDWPNPAISQTDDLAYMATWLTVPRIRALRKMCEMKTGAETLFISNYEQAFVVWRAPDALDSVAELNRVVSKLFEIVKELDGAPAAVQTAGTAVQPAASSGRVNENSNGPSTTETPPA